MTQCSVSISLLIEWEEGPFRVVLNVNQMQELALSCASYKEDESESAVYIQPECVQIGTTTTFQPSNIILSYEPRKGEEERHSLCP